VASTNPEALAEDLGRYVLVTNTVATPPPPLDDVEVGTAVAEEEEDDEDDEEAFALGIMVKSAEVNDASPDDELPQVWLVSLKIWREKDSVLLRSMLLPTSKWYGIGGFAVKFSIRI